MKKYFSSGVALNFYWLLFILMVMVGFQTSPFSKAYPLSDSAVFITCADMLDKGKTMYVDFFDHKGPLIYLFDYIGLKMGGLTGLWILQIVWIMLSANLMYMLCRIYVKKGAAFVATLCGLVMIFHFGCENMVELVALPFICLGLLPLLEAIHKKEFPTLAWALISSLCLGVTLLLRPNIGSLIAFTMLAIALQCILKKFALLGKYAAICIGVILLIGIATYGVMIHYSAWNAFVEDYWQFNLDYSAMLPLSTKLSNGIRLIFITYLCIVSWLMVGIVIYSSRKQKSTFHEDILLTIILLISAFVACGLSGNIYGHYLISIVPFFAIFFAKGIATARQRWTRMAIGLLLALPLYSYVTKCRDTIKIITSPSPEYHKYAAAKKYIQDHTSPNDEICLYGLDPILYHLTDRMPCTKYVYQWMVFSIKDESKEEFFNDIRAHRPKLIAVSSKNAKLLPPDISNVYRTEKSTSPDILFLYYIDN